MSRLLPGLWSEVSRSFLYNYAWTNESQAKPDPAVAPDITDVDLDRDMAGYKRENTELQAEVEKLQGFLSTKSTEFEQYKTKTEQFSRDNRKREDNLDQKFQDERKQASNKIRQLEDENYRLKRNIQQFEETMNKTMQKLQKRKYKSNQKTSKSHIKT